MPIGEIDIFLGFDEPAQPTPAVMIEAEEISGSILSARAEEFRISENPNPTQPALAAMNGVETDSDSDSSIEIGSRKKSYLVAVVDSTSGVLAEEGAGNDSVLDAIGSEGDSADADQVSMTSAELKEYMDEIGEGVESSTPKDSAMETEENPTPYDSMDEGYNPDSEAPEDMEMESSALPETTDESEIP